MAPPIATVGVVGSGIMSAGIVEVIAAAGHDVIVRARTNAGAIAVREAIDRRLSRLVERGRCDNNDRQATLGRISCTEHLHDLATCDLVIETVVENLEIKQHLMAELGRHLADHAIIATNTSTLPVVELAIASGRPDRVAGLHFFNPATAMTLVEIVRPITASDDTIAALHDFARRCDRQIVDVADRAGFVVNALLFPYLNAAIAMAERNTASIDEIDAAMKGGCGFPLGPFELLDLVGLDTSLSILEALHREFGEAGMFPHPALRRLVAAGHFGRKTGRGFRTYT
jgi:3-hydroxybutyryl-CoA dehydrogenase